MLMPVCPPLSSPSAFSCFIAIFVSLDSCFSRAILYICVSSATWAFSLLFWLGSLSVSWGVFLFVLPYPGILFPFPVPVAHSGSLLCFSLNLGPPLSTFLSLSSLVLASTPPSLHPSLCWILPLGLTHFPLISAPFPAPLSSSVPSSPLSPSPSAVSPTGSACCSPCSCTAAWGPWPGAMSPQ